jgi:hypothetical protein
VRIGCLSVDRVGARLWRSLAILTLRRGRQLQHSGGLAGDQPSDPQNPAVWKFKRVVMDVRIFHINLPKPCDPVTYARVSEKKTFVLDVIVKRHLRARKEADGYLGFADGGETAGDRFRKFRRYQLISDLSGARGNEMKTVIAHGSAPLLDSHCLLNKPIRIAVIDLDQRQDGRFADQEPIRV